MSKDSKPRTEWIPNFTYGEISVGQSARLLRTLTPKDILNASAVCTDTPSSPALVTHSSVNVLNDVLAHGVWAGTQISELLATQFPGPGTVYLQQDLHFMRPVRMGDTLTVVVSVMAKEKNNQIALNCIIENQHGEKVLQGNARIVAPTQKLFRPSTNPSEIQALDPQARFRALLSLAAQIKPVSCAVVHPCDAESLIGAMDSAKAGLIVPIFIGPGKRILSLAESQSIDISAFELIDVPHSHAAAEKAAEWAIDGKAQIMMKGSLHTDELIRTILRRPELHTGRRMSHVFRFDVPMYSKPLLVTDAVLNIRPTLLEKMDILQNAIDFSTILGVPNPKVAILAAIEMVNPDMPSTIDAASLCKMAERGQIKGGIVDGPLAFDNAISMHAAHIKGIQSLVAGDADILMVPDLESGNMLAKQLEYFAGASCAGLVLGAKIPISLTSRADSPQTRMASAVLALLASHAREQTC